LQYEVRDNNLLLWSIGGFCGSGKQKNLIFFWGITKHQKCLENSSLGVLEMNGHLFQGRSTWSEGFLRNVSGWSLSISN